MKLSDILVLAKNGYKANDIKELIELADRKADDTEDEKKEVEADDAEDEHKEDTEGIQPEDKTDYKALYEESQTRLKKLQAENRRDQSGHTEKTPEQVAIEYFNHTLK